MHNWKYELCITYALWNQKFLNLSLTLIIIDGSYCIAQLIKFENFSMAFSKRIITMDFDRFGYKWSKETETKHKCELYIGYKNILTSRFAEYFHFPSVSGASFEITFWGRTKCRNFLTLIIKMHYLSCTLSCAWDISTACLFV